MARPQRKSLDPSKYDRPNDLPGIGPGLAQVRERDRTDPGRFLRAAGKTGSDEEQEADLLFESRRKALLDEARENGISFDLSDCFAKDLDALEAKLADSLPQVPRKMQRQVNNGLLNNGQSEVTEVFCQAHFARVVDLAQATPITVTRQGQPLVVVLSPEQYAALSATHPVA